MIKKKYKRWYVVFLCFILGKGLLLAQYVPYYHYSSDNGLPSNTTYDIIEDREGYIWIPTDKGIVKFNGAKFENISNKLNVPIKDTHTCILDVDNKMWLFSKDSRVFYISNDSLFQFNFGFDKFYFVSNQSVFFSKGNGELQFYYFNKQRKIDSIELKKEMLIRINFIQDLDSKVLLLYSDGNIWEFDKNTKIKKEIRKGSKENTILTDDLLFSPKYFGLNTFLYQTQDSVFLFKNKVHKGLFSRQALQGLNLITISQNKIILHNDITGFFFSVGFDGKNLKKLPLKPIIHDKVSIIIDRNQNWWIDTKTQGIYFYPRRSLNNKNVVLDASKDVSPNITKIIKQGDTLFFLNDNIKKFHFLSEGKINTIQKADQNNMYSISKYRNILIGGNFTMYSNKKFKDLYFNGKQAVLDFTKIDKYFVGNSKFGFRENALGTLRFKEIIKLDTSHFLIGGCYSISELSFTENRINLNTVCLTKDCVYSMLRTKSGKIILGTTKGVFELLNNEVSKSPIHPKLQGFCRTLLEDSFNNIWVGEDNLGLCYITKNKRFYNFKELQSTIISQIVAGRNPNEVWVSSSKGIYRLSINEQGVKGFKRFAEGDGIKPNSLNTIFIDENKVYYGSSSGLNVLELNEEDKVFRTPLVCENIRIDNALMPYKSQYDLKYTQNSIVIELAHLSYESIGNVEYEYALDKFSAGTTSWQVTKSNSINFYNLAPQKYRFRARSYDVYGNLASNEIEIIFNIQPPFWSTWAFLGFISSLLIILPLWYWKRRYNKQQMQKLQESTLMIKLSDIKLESLQSQLNSHFIFNALNAVQNLIVSGDEIAATDFLNKFSRLVRGYLEASRNKFVSIEDDIELLKYYISLEELRFGDKFKSIVTLDTNIDNTYYIPPNIIQPFVENAIEHGLHKRMDNKGNLYVDISKVGEKIVCTVEDNGIGRINAEKTKYNIRNKSSLGLKILEERFTALKTTDNLDFHFEISDSSNDVQYPGTKVILVFPIIIKPLSPNSSISLP